MKTFANYLVFVICALGTILDACSGYGLNIFYKHMLEEHNKYRKLHGLPFLVLDEDLCKDAQKYIQLIKPGQLEYLEENSKISNEAVCYTYETADTTEWENELIAYNILSLWYNEGENYNYKEDNIFKSAEHFTQIVWESTREFGVAVTQNSYEILVVVCYNPPGNIIDKYLINVKEPIQQTDINE